MPFVSFNMRCLMERTVSYFLIILLLLTSKSIIAQVAVGIYGGLDQSKFSGDLPKNYTYEFKNGYVAGLSFDFAIAKDVFIGLRPNFTQNGANISLPGDDVTISPLLTDPIDTIYLFPITNQYLALPVLVQIYVSRAFYANSGIDFSYNLSSNANVFGNEIDINEHMSEYLLHAIFGFGFSIPMGRTSINLEFTYSQGINKLTKRVEIEDGSAPRLRTRRFRFAAYFTVFATKKIL